MPGARCARSLACSVKNTRVSHHGHTGITRPSPRNGFNGFLRALPGDRAFLPPSPALLSANLTPASGRQDHTSSPSASHAVRQERIRVHRIPPRVRDDRDTPLEWGGTANHIVLIWGSGKQKYFCLGGWTAKSPTSPVICPSGKIG